MLCKENFKRILQSPAFLYLRVGLAFVRKARRHFLLKTALLLASCVRWLFWCFPFASWRICPSLTVVCNLPEEAGIYRYWLHIYNSKQHIDLISRILCSISAIRLRGSTASALLDPSHFFTQSIKNIPKIKIKISKAIKSNLSWLL